ncbi:TetR family transcriptional regulator, partial [Deinococcus aestuarii]|uniref:TetR family transcriptional regulator n=1 Tax=Deinococcus aestuarii TaxID=2774531 RepID=UPI001C0AFB8D
MTAQARRARHKQATREGILQAALTIGEQEGWAAVTIRRIADAVEYTSPIIY